MLFLIIPWLLLLLLVVTAILLIKKKWIAAGVLAIVIVVLNCWSDCFCFGFKNYFKGDLKVLSFNVNGLGVYEEGKANAILGIILDEKPDVVFFTENFKPLCDSLYDKLHTEYPYDTRRLNL